MSDYLTDPLDARTNRGQLLLTERGASIDEANVSGRWLRGDPVEVRQ